MPERCIRYRNDYAHGPAASLCWLLLEELLPSCGEKALNGAELAVARRGGAAMREIHWI
jgi:hypothetical protein